MVYLPILALIMGICGTTSLHLAKAMTRQGIDALKIRTDIEERGKKGTIWTIGFILNNIVTVFGIIAGWFGPASLYSAPFGIGLVILLLYAYYILKEKITKRDLIGAALIIMGTVGIGMVKLFYTMDQPTIIYPNFYLSIWIMVPLGITLVIIGYISKNLTLTIILFASTGGMLSVMGQNWQYAGNLLGGFYPHPFILAPVYIIGLIMGTISFLISQVAFARGADASKYVPIFNGAFFITPFIYEMFIFVISGTELIAFFLSLPFIVIVLIGIYFLVGMLVRTIKNPEIETLSY